MKDFREQFLSSAGEHLSDEMHNRQWQMYGANLSACMGFLPGRSQRHQCRGSAIGTMGYYPGTQKAWGTSGYEGAAHPTIEDVLRCNGEGRGGAILLYQAIAQGRARFVDRSGVLQPIPVDDVDMIADGVLYFSQADIHKKYESDSAGSVFVGAANLFRDSEEYHDKVVGMRPHPLCPSPSETLYWEGRLRDGMDASGLPPGYVRLEKLKKMEEWPEEHREWPSPANHDLYRHFPSGRPGWGWYSVWQIIPKAMSKLAKVLGTAWIGCCKVQIMIVDGEGVRRHLIIGWRNQYNELVGTDLLRGHVQAMAERHGFSSEGPQASGSANQWTTREAGSDWRGPLLEGGASAVAPASGPSGAASTVGTWPDLLSYVSE